MAGIDGTNLGSGTSRGWIIIIIPILLAVGILTVIVGAYVHAYENASTVISYNGAPNPWLGWWSWWGWGGGGQYLFPFGWLFVFPVIFLAFFALRWFLWGRWYYPYEDPAMETLRRRFANGEVTKEEFEQMKRDLAAPPSR